VDLTVTIPAHLSHTGLPRTAIKSIDRCLAPIVKALNAGGVITTACCCGHGKTPGEIILADGRTLVIAMGLDHSALADLADDDCPQYTLT